MKLWIGICHILFIPLNGMGKRFTNMNSRHAYLLLKFLDLLWLSWWPFYCRILFLLALLKLKSRLNWLLGFQHGNRKLSRTWRNKCVSFSKNSLACPVFLCPVQIFYHSVFICRNHIHPLTFMNMGRRFWASYPWRKMIKASCPFQMLSRARRSMTLLEHFLHFCNW